MINIEYFNEMDRKISQAGVRELLEIRKEVLSEAAKIEESVLEAADEGVICWVEDEAFVYRKQMEWVAKYANRMMDLGCTPEVNFTKQCKLIEDAKAYVEADLKIQREGVESLYKMMPSLASDPTTYDITKAYLADEEEDLYWSEEQLDKIEKIGYPNWLMKMM